MVLLSVLDVVLVVLGGAGMLYQAVCIVISLFAKPIKFPEAPMNKRYAVLISARNEANVIGNLIDCLHSQTYPSELIDIWLVADNCTDNTAEVARNMGCHVIERFNKEQVGKGYALTYLLDQMNESGASDPYDAFFVFDADNKLDKHYIEEMNKGFQAGFKILTSYRNSVNLSDNWVSSGSALWFIRRIALRFRLPHVARQQLPRGRHRLHVLPGDHASQQRLEIPPTHRGSGIHHGQRAARRPHRLLRHRHPVRRAAGHLRAKLASTPALEQGIPAGVRYYGPALIKRAVRERDFSAVDFTLLLCPFTVLGIARVLLGMLFAACGFVTWQSQLNSLTGWTSGIVISVIGMMGLAALTIVAERDHVGATNKELLAYVLAFPIYMLSYVPISFQAVFAKSEWKPIEHKG